MKENLVFIVDEGDCCSEEDCKDGECCKTDGTPEVLEEDDGCTGCTGCGFPS